MFKRKSKIKDNRYIRQISLIGKDGQEKIKKACVIIVGAGGLGNIAAKFLASSGVNTILSITPAETATHLDPNSVTEIVVTFSEAIDATTIDDDSVLIWTEPVNGDFDDQDITYAGTIAKILSVSGNTLTIQIS